MSFASAALLLKVLHVFSLLCGFLASADSLPYRQAHTDVSSRERTDLVTRRHPGTEAGLVSVSHVNNKTVPRNEKQTASPPTDREYRISVLGREMVVKVTGNCEAIGSNTIIQTVTRGNVISATFGNSLLRHCYQGEVQSPQRSKVILTSMQQGTTGIAVMGNGIVFFRPSPLFRPLTRSTTSSRRAPREIYRRSAVLSNADPTDSGQSDTSIQGDEDDLDGLYQQNTPHVKVLLVVDKLTVDRHEEGLENYVLTIMSIVQELFSNHSLGFEIKFSVVRLILLENAREFPITSRARSTLRAFCEWQKRLFALAHHDLAILLTGHDMCLSSTYSCNTAGHSKFNSMCHASKTCLVVEDRGLPTAFSIAHEIGRIFGVSRDDRSTSSNCSAHHGYIMSHFTAGMRNLFRWSECSKRALATSIRNASCLYKMEPVRSPSGGGLPGEIYNASQQCQLLRLDGTSRICPYYWARQEVCHRLWCTLPNGTECHTIGTPAADGTPCGTRNVCMKGSCVGVKAGHFASGTGNGYRTHSQGSGDKVQRCPRPAQGQTISTTTAFNSSNIHKQWDVLRNGSIRLRQTNLCIAVGGPHSETQGFDLILDRCSTGLTGSTFRYNPLNGVIQETDTYLCLTVTDSGAALMSCVSTGAKEQEWAVHTSSGSIASLSLSRQLCVCG